MPGTTFSPLYVYWKNIRRSRSSNSKLNSQIHTKVKLVQDLMLSILPARMKIEPSMESFCPTAQLSP